MRLTVLNVSYPLARVDESTAGGAEHILATIDRGLVEAGHRSIVVAPALSKPTGELFPSSPIPNVLDDETQTRIRREFRATVQRAVDMFCPDIIHLHGIDFADYIPGGEVPLVITLHLPLGWYSAGSFSLGRSHAHFVCVSKSQASTSVTGLDVTVIENGIDLDRFTLRTAKEDYVLCMGRICPEKGFHLAIDAARASGTKLLIAGELYEYPSHREYFETFIKPCLGEEVEFVGAVGSERKNHLLGAAKCLLVPSLAPETSSLVAMEAMACGTPVVAFRSGALTEVVSDGRTAYLVGSAEEMAEAIPAAATLDPRECRREAEERFSSRRMVDGYLRLYSQVRHRNASFSDPQVMTSQVLQAREDFPRLTADWERLWNACDATPFQRPEWILSWIKIFEPQHPLLITVYRDQELVGLAPLLIYSHRGERVLGLMAGGISDYLDVLAHPDCSGVVVQRIWQHINELSPEWDRVDLTDLPLGSPMLRYRAPETEVVRHDVCPVIDLASANRLAEVVSSRQLRNVRNARARLQRFGEGRIQVATEDNLEKLIEAMIRLHEERWSETSGGVLGDTRIQRFHREVAPALLRKGVLRLYALSLNNRVIATLYALEGREALYCYLQGFDPEFKWISPGAQIVAAVIEDSVRLRKRTLDFLRGAESYKYAWGATDQCTYRMGSLRQELRTIECDKLHVSGE